MAQLSLLLLVMAFDLGASGGGAGAAQSEGPFVTRSECDAASRALAASTAASLVRYDRSGNATVRRSAWESALIGDDRSALIWNLARIATCADGRVAHVVRVADERGILLATQEVSFDPRCHGDRAGPGTWYRC